MAFGYITEFNTEIRCTVTTCFERLGSSLTMNVVRMPNVLFISIYNDNLNISRQAVIFNIQTFQYYNDLIEFPCLFVKI